MYTHVWLLLDPVSKMPPCVPGWCDVASLFPTKTDGLLDDTGQKFPAVPFLLGMNAPAMKIAQ